MHARANSFRSSMRRGGTLPVVFSFSFFYYFFKFFLRTTLSFSLLLGREGSVEALFLWAFCHCCTALVVGKRLVVDRCSLSDLFSVSSGCGFHSNNIAVLRDYSYLGVVTRFILSPLAFTDTRMPRSWFSRSLFFFPGTRDGEV